MLHNDLWGVAYPLSHLNHAHTSFKAVGNKGMARIVLSPVAVYLAFLDELGNNPVWSIFPTLPGVLNKRFSAYHTSTLAWENQRLRLYIFRLDA